MKMENKIPNEKKIDWNAWDEAYGLLKEKGFSLGEIINIRNAFAEWGKTFDKDIKHDHKYNYFSSEKAKGYAFHKEEAKFFNALIDFSPNSNKEKLIQVMSIVMKLLNIESVWTFKSN